MKHGLSLDIVQLYITKETFDNRIPKHLLENLVYVKYDLVLARLIFLDFV